MSSIGKLIVYSTRKQKVAEFKLGDQVFLIGRGESNDLTISDPLPLMTKLRSPQFWPHIESLGHYSCY